MELRNTSFSSASASTLCSLQVANAAKVMGPKPKAVKAAATSARKPNGIKGITVAEKSNDPLRDALLSKLRSSGTTRSVESKIVFAHTGIYVGGVLFGWVGPQGFSVRCNNAKQKQICKDHGCPVMESEGHKGDNYYTVPENIQKNAAKLRSLAEAIVEAAPVKGGKSTKK
jgi:TfoX/Sxy family transcriptional regulator of competence genes